MRLTALPVDAVEERGRGVDDAAPDGPRSACRGAHSRDATTQPRASRRDAPRDITAGRAGESAHTAKKSRSHCLSIAPIGTPTGSSVAQRAPRRTDWGSPRSVCGCTGIQSICRHYFRVLRLALRSTAPTKYVGREAR